MPDKKTYMFVFNGTPAKTNLDCADIAGAKTHVWVTADDVNAARIAALGNVSGRLWDVQEIEYEFEIPPERIPLLGEDESRLYREALKNGIASDYIGWPKEPRADGAPAMIRKL